MAEKEAHEDLKGSEHLTMIIEPRPEIHVFVAKNERISILVKEVGEATDAVEEGIVQIPLDCAEQVGNALIEIANKYGRT